MKEIQKYKLFVLTLIVTICSIPATNVLAEDTNLILPIFNVVTLGSKPILEVKLEGDSFQRGKPVEINLSIKNKTDFTVVLFDVAPERSFDITVEDENGLELPLSKNGKELRFPNNILNRETIYLESGKEFKFDKVRLDKLFDFKDIGNYTIKVKRKYYLQDSSGRDIDSASNILSTSAKFNMN